MKKLLLILILLSFNSFANTCFSLSTTVTKTDAHKVNWIKVEKQLIDHKYDFVISLKQKLEEKKLETIILAMADDQIDNIEMTVSLAFDLKERNAESSFLIHEKFYQKSWLIVSYAGCDKYFYFRLSEL